MCICDKTDHVAISANANQTVESRVIKFWIQPSDSSVQAGFPKKIGQKVIGVSETIGYRNVAYATAMSHMHSGSMPHYAYRVYGISVLVLIGN